MKLLENLKFCGITERTTAELCATLGCGAVGAVFYPPSPRHVSPRLAAANFAALPDTIARIGVFVDTPVDEILAIAQQAALTGVQLHGSESPEVAAELLATGLRVIKVLKTAGAALVQEALAWPEDVGILVECGQGILPGGNGAAWEWSMAAPLARERPCALAGGLDAQNLTEALRMAQASGADLSSALESAPGVKDHCAIRRVAALAREHSLPQGTAPFWRMPDKR